MGGLSLPILAHSDQGIKQGNLCAGSGKDHEHQLFDIPHMAPELAIEDLKELHQQKKHSKNKNKRNQNKK